MLLLAVKNGLAFTKITGGSLVDMLRSGWQMKQSNGLSFGQTLMAANAPMMIQEAMVKGHPDKGILPSGQVAGAITDLPTGAELMQSIIDEAQATLNNLSTLV
jgi:NAD(P)H-dependent flavin oxidoreductase YrpB (nitropropane dioxygenase family)